MSAAKQKFRERHKVIKPTQIEARTKKVGCDSAGELVAIDVAFEMIAAHLRGQSKNPVRVEGEPARRTMAIEVAEATAWIKVDVAVTGVKFVPGHELPWSACIFRRFCCLRAQEWSCFGNCRQSK